MMQPYVRVNGSRHPARVRLTVCSLVDAARGGLPCRELSPNGGWRHR